jgi:hypothetical protein
MSKALRLSTLALVGATATGVIAFTAPAIADDGSGIAYKRDDSSGQVITTADLDDDDDQANKSTNTGTHTNTGGGTNTNTGTNTGTDTGTRTRGGNTDHSQDRKVRDHTSDGPGSGNVDRTRGHTNDGTRHNTRG